MRTLVQHSTVLMTTLLYETYIVMSCKVFAGLSNKNLGTKNLIRPKSTWLKSTLLKDTLQRARK
uniref:Uncharacterized protein n=1 Tax=Glossina palpalis gambiensis TaxID=67801 RepID=A0A1B0AUZ2_9MUSC